MSKSKPSLPAGYSIGSGVDDEDVTVRRARTWHRCDGGYYNDSNEHRNCTQVIAAGTVYLAVRGKTHGYKHHLDCAVERGLLEKE